jgi:phosphatidylglycerol:prolipoprotein diacylglycerol transferase
MYIHSIDPVIFSLGPLSVRWYGLFYVIGFLITYWWLRKIAKEKTIKNLTPEHAENYMLWMIISIIVGARIFEFIFFQPQTLLQDPLELFRIWNGGMSFHGGLISICITTWYFTKKYSISFLKLADALVLPAAIALFLGRIANFINSELPGKISDVSWCVQFPQAPDPAHRIGCRHPSQLYESLKNLLLFGLLLTLRNTWKERASGTLFWLFVTFYGLLRFAINFWRDDPALFLGLSMGQILSILMFFIGIIGIYTVTRKQKNT